MSLYIELAKTLISRTITATHFKEITGYWTGYRTNPSRSQSSPWATPDWARRWHPFDAMLSERRDVLKSERQQAEAKAKKDTAWWDERRRG